MDAYYYTPVCPSCHATTSQENMGIDTNDDGTGEVKMKCKICTNVYTIFAWKVSTEGTGDYDPAMSSL